MAAARSTADNARSGMSKPNDYSKNESSSLNRCMQKNDGSRNSFSTSQKNSPSFGGFVPALSNSSSSSFSTTSNNLTLAQASAGNTGGYSTSSAVAATNPTFRKRQYPLTQQQQNVSPVPSSKLTPGRSVDTISPPILSLIPEKRRVTSSNQQNNYNNNSSNSFVAESMPVIQPLETTPSLTPSSAVSSIDSPNSLYSGSGGKSSLPQYHVNHQPPSSQRNSSAGGNSVQTNSAASSTNWRQSSLSPDENIDKFQRGGRSLTMPTKPSRDWSQVFGQIENLCDAKKYHEIFSVSFFNLTLNCI